MMKRLAALLATLMICLGSWPQREASAAFKDGFGGSGSIAVVSISKEQILSRVGQAAELDHLKADEYYSFIWDMEYTGDKAIEVENFYVRVDNGPQWGWSVKSLHPGDRYALHIYHVNMQTCMTPGEHTVTWYVNDQAVLTETFTLTLASAAGWEKRFDFPTQAEIAEANRTATVRSPYLYGWQEIGKNQRYTEYAIDFKADFVPKATYCALVNLELDLSPLKKKYKNVRTEYQGVNLYAGFQRRWEDYATIMSLWDIYYTDKNGVEHTLRPKRLYPVDISIGKGDFTGEGTGLQLLEPFDWKAGQWYRMLLQCKQGESGTTQVEQWVCDLQTNRWTLVSKCDTGIPDTCFKGPNAFFLENFDPQYAGEIRAMEVKNVRIKDAKTGKWKAVKSASLGSDSGLPKYNGSYAYGSDKDCFWMITSGAGGDWYGTKKAPKNNKKYTVKNTVSDQPY